jgi:dTDP-4-amino-4,6-dideoxygalactose transaminase
MTAYPMFKVPIDTDAALQALREVFVSGFVNEGLQVLDFQRAVSQFLGAEQLVLTNSCTSALTMALELCGVGPGAEVISTPMTCVATNSPIVKLGGRIVWADIDPNTGSIDAGEIDRKVTSATAAIMCVAWAGTPCDLDAIEAVAKHHGVPLIQDAAQAFGAMWRNRPISDFADYTCYSFQAIKHLCCGDGGALACRNPDKWGLARKIKWFGYDREAHKDEKGEWKGQRWNADIKAGEVGYKFNMNNVAAAIGLSQMPRLPGILEAHRRNGAAYNRAFAQSRTVRLLTIPKAAVSSYWVYSALLSAPQVDRDMLLEHLNSEGIAAGLVHVPNDTYSAFKAYRAELPGVREFAARQISLPCGWWLSEEECTHIAARVHAVAARLTDDGLDRRTPIAASTKYAFRHTVNSDG